MHEAILLRASSCRWHGQLALGFALADPLVHHLRLGHLETLQIHGSIRFRCSTSSPANTNAIPAKFPRIRAVRHQLDDDFLPTRNDRRPLCCRSSAAPRTTSPTTPARRPPPPVSRPCCLRRRSTPAGRAGCRNHPVASCREHRPDNDPSEYTRAVSTLYLPLRSSPCRAWPRRMPASYSVTSSLSGSCRLWNSNTNKRRLAEWVLQGGDEVGGAVGTAGQRDRPGVQPVAEEHRHLSRRQHPPHHCIRVGLGREPRRLIERTHALVSDVLGLLLFQSCRRASIGSSRAARYAGYKPKITLTPIETPSTT